MAFSKVGVANTVRSNVPPCRASSTRVLLELRPHEVQDEGEYCCEPTSEPLVLFAGDGMDENIYCEEIEQFFDVLPYPSLKIGQLTGSGGQV